MNGSIRKVLENHRNNLLCDIDRVEQHITKTVRNLCGFKADLELLNAELKAVNEELDK